MLTDHPSAINMMRLQYSLVALSALLRVVVAAYDVSSRQPGVGISLSGGYATVSAFFPNGSYIDITKAEGDATYKAYMLGLQEDPIKTIPANYCPFSPKNCQYWPFKNAQTQNPLAPILEALITTAESTLEMTIESLAVSTYDTNTIDYTLAKADVHTALSELGVDSYNRLDHVALHLAPALGIQGKCSEPYTLPEDSAYFQDPEQFLLAIEYSQDSMTAGLWKEECGVMEMINRWNSAELGHHAMQTCRETAKNTTTCEEAFKNALRSVSEDSSRDQHEEIGPVLIFGECAEDDAMLSMLRQVLSEQFPNGDSMDLSRVRKFSPDPAFSGSRSMAATAWAVHSSEHEGHHMEEL